MSFDLRAYNRFAWDHEGESNNVWTRPVASDGIALVGGVSGRSNEPVLKTGEAQASGGSNPSPSATLAPLLNRLTDSREHA